MVDLKSTGHSAMWVRIPPRLPPFHLVPVRSQPGDVGTNARRYGTCTAGENRRLPYLIQILARSPQCNSCKTSTPFQPDPISHRHIRLYVHGRIKLCKDGCPINRWIGGLSRLVSPNAGLGSSSAILARNPFFGPIAQRLEQVTPDRRSESYWVHQRIVKNIYPMLKLCILVIWIAVILYLTRNHYKRSKSYITFMESIDPYLHQSKPKSKD